MNYSDFIEDKIISTPRTGFEVASDDEFHESLFLTKPSDLGYSDEGYDLPGLKVHYRPGLWPWKFRPCGGHGHNPMLPAVVSFSKPKADGTRTRNCKRRSAWYRGPIRSDGRGSDPIPGTPIIPRSHSYRPQVPAQGIRAGSQVAGYARG